MATLASTTPASRPAPAPPPYSPALLRDMARVQARYLLRVWRERGGPFAERVATQTPWRDVLGASHPWEPFVERTAALLLGKADALPEAERVERFLAYAGPLFARGPMATGEELTRYRWFGCFRFHPHPDEKAISIHIRNNVMPRSPFADRPTCCRSLAELCDAAAGEAFPIETVICGTWLNDLPVFLELFPPAYRGSLQASNPDWAGGWGWWGQLVDRTGSLHARRAAVVLETGRFPHPRSEGRCGFDEFREHVKTGGQTI